MVVTEKRHMYETGTVNVETGNVAVKQDINYYNANVQSATRSIIRFIEDSDRRFSQNQIYDGATVSNGGSTVDVASGTLKIGGRWVSLSGTGISAAVSDDIYFVVAQVTGVSETNSRDPSGGEAVTLTLVASGSYSATDWKLVLGSAVISSSTVQSVQDRAKRQVNATIIKPYGSATQVSIYTGDSPVYREAIRFTANKILPYNNIESAFDITGNKISGTTLDVSGQTNVADVSGSAISAVSFAIGSKVLSQSEFDNLDGQDQGVRSTDDPTFVNLTGTSITIGANRIDTNEWANLDGLDQPVKQADSPSFVRLTATQTGSSISPFIVSSTAIVANLNVDQVDGYDLDQPLLEASSPQFVQITATQTGSSIPPFIVTSTNKVTNLNADKVDGYDFDQSLKKDASPEFRDLTITFNGTLDISNGILEMGNGEIRTGNLIIDGANITNLVGNLIFDTQAGMEIVFYENINMANNSIVGTGHIVPQSHDTYDLGSDSNKWDDIYATNGTIITSMKSYKTDIEDLEPRDEGFMSLKAKKFKWKDNISKNKKTQLGLIAEEVFNYYPEVIKTNKDDEIVGMYYNKLIPILWEKVQRLHNEIELLKS